MKNKVIFLALVLAGVATVSSSFAADIIYIGDSHSTGCFGRTLDVTLRTLKTKENPQSTERPATVITQASCGSASSHWLKSNGHVTRCGTLICDVSGNCDSRNSKTDSIGMLLEKEKPKVTVVALGTNMIKGKRDQSESEARSLILKIKEAGSQCIWIGPPQAALFFSPEAKFNEFVEKLESVVESEGCRFVSSVDKTARENLNDSMGLHYGCKDAETWAKKTIPVLKPLVEAALAQTPADTDSEDDAQAVAK
ncbi:MAG: SGNH/GDSL hydrolase family protein [Deltaproteobacteria bacterium]|nr:SGNH/GDSL hydrolase family protein [Deltaproteobacteria bacterium]